MRGEWFEGLEECYLAAIEEEQKYFDEAKAAFEEAKNALKEAKAALKKFRAKYPPNYDGPTPWY